MSLLKCQVCAGLEPQLTLYQLLLDALSLRYIRLYLSLKHAPSCYPTPHFLSPLGTYHSGSTKELLVDPKEMFREGRAWWCMPLIPALRMLRKEALWDFEPSLGYTSQAT